MMQVYEYRVIPAPRRGLKAKGVGSATEDRFAYALQIAMNDMGAQGWDYVRADTLPCEERQGLTGRTTAYHNMLVFRRALPVDQPVDQPLTAPHSAPMIAVPAAATVAAPVPGPLQLTAPLPQSPPLGPADRVAAQ